MKSILYFSALLLQKIWQNNPSVSHNSTVTESDTCTFLNSSVIVEAFIHYSTMSVNIHSACGPRGSQRKTLSRQHFISTPSFHRRSSFFSPSAYNSIRASSARAAVSITGCILLINTWPGGGRLRMTPNRAGEREEGLNRRYRETDHMTDSKLSSTDLICDA